MAKSLQLTKSSNVTNAQGWSNLMTLGIKRVMTEMKRLSGSAGIADDYGATLA